MEKWFVTCNGWGEAEAMCYDSEAEARKAIEDYLRGDYNSGDDHFTYTMFKGEQITNAALPQEIVIRWF